jgi:hypothetical protein
MIRRLIIAQAFVLIGLGLVFFLPKSPPIKDAALRIDLPRWAGDWEGGDDLDPGERELQILAKDTTFARRNYKRDVPLDQIPSNFTGRRPQDVVNFGIVLGGKDPAASIHALERCLTAQGISILGASTLLIPLKTGQLLPVRKLLCQQASRGDGPPIHSISYYWFVGHNAVTGNHIRRGVLDFADRMIKGYDQRWAYITATTYLDPLPIEDPGLGEVFRRALTEEQSDALVKSFLLDLGHEVMITDQIVDWSRY